MSPSKRQTPNGNPPPENNCRERPSPTASKPLKPFRRFCLTALLCGACLALIELGFFLVKRQSPPPIVGEPPHDFDAITAKLDATVWAPEIAGQRFAAQVEQLWDDLRAAEAPFAVLVTVPFGNLIAGDFSKPRSIEHEIAIRTMQGPKRSIPPAERKRRFAFIETQRLALEQSEWRHERFWPERDGAPQSRYTFSLHMLQPVPETRYIVRGRIRIRWRPQTEEASPAMESVEVLDAELLSRQGATPFAHVVPADLTPRRGSLRFEPNLQVCDLDRNGLADIVVSRINRVYWNQGQGQFHPAPLCDFPLPFLNSGLLADFDSDGTVDFLGVNCDGLALFHGTAEGKFPFPPEHHSVGPSVLLNSSVMTAGDIDNDGDLDLWLAQYRVPFQDGQMPTPFYDANDGYPSYLLRNDGAGRFTDATEAAGLAAKRYRRTYSASFVDWDDDGDADLITVNDFAGIDLYQNDGSGRFRDVSGECPDRHGFGMAHTFGDFDNNGSLDVLMIGMNAYTAHRLDHLGLAVARRPDYAAMRPAMAFGNRLFYQHGRRFRQTAHGQQIARTGWSWGVSSGDFDNDGDEDFYVVNGHITGASVRDYQPRFWLYDLYLGNSSEDPALDAFFQSQQNAARASGASFGGHEQNRFFLNRGKNGFLEIGYLLGMSLDIDCRNLISEDLDGDGKLEWLALTFESWPEPKQALHLFPNFTAESGNWIGLRIENAPGTPAIGAVARLTTKAGTQKRHIVTGDSYRSQHSTTLHFGIGKLDQTQSLEIRWPNGARQTLNQPAAGVYHAVKPLHPRPASKQ